MDDDTKRIALGLLPASIASHVEVATADGSPSGVNAWSNATRTADNFGLHSSKLLWFEANTPGTTTVKLRWKTKDGFYLDPHTVHIHAIRVQVTDGTAPQQHLNVSTWENAYLEPENPVAGDIAWPTVQNVPPAANGPNGGQYQHFIDADPRRFFVAVHDEASIAASVSIGTFDATGTSTHTDATTVDNMTAIPLYPSDPNPDAPSVSTSKSQMLVGLDFPIEENELFLEPAVRVSLAPYKFTDDDYPVFDGVSAVVPDDGVGDRTHMAKVDNGFLAVRYSDLDSTFRLPICQRTPDKRGAVRVRILLFMEPFKDDPNWPGGTIGEFDWTDTDGNGRHDLGEDSEPYLDLSNASDTFLSGSNADQDGARGIVLEEEPADRIRRDFERARIGWAPACLRFVQYRAESSSYSPWLHSNDTFVPVPIDVPNGADPVVWSEALASGANDPLFSALSRYRPSRLLKKSRRLRWGIDTTIGA